MSQPVGCRLLKSRILRGGVILVLAGVVPWILDDFVKLQIIREATAQDSSEVYKRVYDGWKWWHVYCYRCHGVDAIGTTLAPNLTDPKRKLAYEEFLRMVRNGTPQKGMPAWDQLLSDKQITEIYTYVSARTEKLLPRGRPDEVGPNGGPWTPPAGWVAAVSTSAIKLLRQLPPPHPPSGLLTSKVIPRLAKRYSTIFKAKLRVGDATW